MCGGKKKKRMRTGGQKDECQLVLLTQILCRVDQRNSETSLTDEIGSMRKKEVNILESSSRPIDRLLRTRDSSSACFDFHPRSLEEEHEPVTGISNR